MTSMFTQASLLSQTLQITLELSGDIDELREMLATAHGDVARLSAEHHSALVELGAALEEVKRLQLGLAAEQAAHVATCEAWKQDKAFRAATAPKHNGSLPERTIPRRQVQPPIEEMDT